MSRTTRVARRLRTLALGSAISLVPLVAPATEIGLSFGDLLDVESSFGTTGADWVASQPTAPAKTRRCFIDATTQACKGTGRRVAGFPDVVWNLTPNASPGSSDLTSTGAVDLLKEFVRTHPDTFPLTDAEDFVDIEVVRIKPHAGSADEPESAVIQFRQLYSGFEILDGKINMDVVEGALRTLAGTVLSRTRVAAAMDSELRKGRVDYRVAAAEVVASYGRSAVESHEGEEAVLHVAEGRLVYTIYSGATVYHVDAVTAQTVRTGSTMQYFAPADPLSSFPISTRLLRESSRNHVSKKTLGRWNCQLRNPLQKIGRDGGLVDSDNDSLRPYGSKIEKCKSTQIPGEGACLVLATHPKQPCGHCFLFQDGDLDWDPSPTPITKWPSGWRPREVWKIELLRTQKSQQGS